MRLRKHTLLEKYFEWVFTILQWLTHPQQNAQDAGPVASPSRSQQRTYITTGACLLDIKSQRPICPCHQLRGVVNLKGVLQISCLKVKQSDVCGAAAPSLSAAAATAAGDGDATSEPPPVAATPASSQPSSAVDAVRAASSCY